MASENELDVFLNPKSVAIIGATERPGSWGSFLMNGLQSCDYAGKIFPVNITIQGVVGYIVRVESDIKYIELSWKIIDPYLENITLDEQENISIEIQNSDGVSVFDFNTQMDFKTKANRLAVNSDNWGNWIVRYINYNVYNVTFHIDMYKMK